MRKRGFFVLAYTLLFAGALVIPQAPPHAADKKIVVVEKSNNADDETHHKSNKKNLPTGATAVEATDLDDAESKIKGQLGAGDCIKELHFRGHGSPGNQSVGDGVNHEDSKRIDGGDPKWKEKLKDLIEPNNRFCEGATIHLWGCNVGSCDEGAEKLHEIAKYFGVTAKGAVNKVTAGKQNEYSGPIQEATPDMEHPPQCIPATDEKAKKKKSGEGCSAEMESDPVDLYGEFPTTRAFTVTEMSCDLVPNNTCFGYDFNHARYQSYPTGIVGVTFDTLLGNAGLIITDLDWSYFYNQPIDLGVVTILFDSMKTVSVDLAIDSVGDLEGSAVLLFYTNIGAITGLSFLLGDYDYQTGDLDVQTLSYFTCGGGGPIIDAIEQDQGITFAWYQDGVMMEDVDWYYTYLVDGAQVPTIECHIGKLDFRATHPEHDGKSVQFSFFRPPGQNGWRQTIFSYTTGGTSDVYAVGGYPGEWHIPDIAALLGSACGDTIFTAVDLTLYGASNPDGFGEPGGSVGKNLSGLGVIIVDGQVEGLEGIYWATSEWTLDTTGRSIFKPIGGIGTLLNSADCPDDLEVIAEHVGGMLDDGTVCCIGTRGNVDGDADESVNIGDLTFLVSYLFDDGSPPPCWEEADVNGDYSVNVADVTFLVDYLFSGGPAPLSCP